MNRIYKNILIIVAIVILLIIIKNNIVIYEGKVGCPGKNVVCFSTNIIQTSKSIGNAVSKAVNSVYYVLAMSADMGAIFTSAFAPQPNNV